MCKILYVHESSYVDAEIINFDTYSTYGKNIALGIPFEGAFPLMEILANERPKDIFKVGIWTIVSDKFINLLKLIGAEGFFQSFSVEVKVDTGEVLHNYSVIHIIREVDCFDEIMSEFELKRGLYFNVKKIFLDESKVNKDDSLFRVKNYPRSLMVLNSKAVGLFESSSISGVELFDFDQWNSTFLM